MGCAITSNVAFSRKSRNFAPFWTILPPFCHPVDFESGRGQPLSGTPGKRAATFALVTTVGPQPRPARSTPGAPARAADRQAFANLSYPTDRQVVRNRHVGRPGFLASMSTHPRTAVRPGRCACLLLITELPKLVGTIPIYIVYDTVTQCFGEPCPGQCDFRKNRTIGSTRYTAACSLVSRPPSIPWNVAPPAQSTPASKGSTHRRVSSDVAGPFSAVCSRVASSDQERPWHSYLLLREKVPRRGG